MRRIEDPDAIAWLSTGANGDQGWFCGWDVGGWETAAWILHPMYETDELPAGLTVDEEAKIAEAAGLSPLEELLAHPRLGPILEGATLVSGGPRRELPPEAWRRLRWSELADRLGVQPELDPGPGYWSFPFRSWPVNIDGPDEGCLDSESLARLVDILASASPGAGERSCLFYYGLGPALAGGDVDAEALLLAGPLADVATLLDDDPGWSPSNVWPEDRSWFIYTDWDFCGTKVSGSRSLIEALTADEELETVEIRP